MIHLFRPRTRFCAPFKNARVVLEGSDAGQGVTKTNLTPRLLKESNLSMSEFSAKECCDWSKTVQASCTKRPQEGPIPFNISHYQKHFCPYCLKPTHY